MLTGRCLAFWCMVQHATPPVVVVLDHITCRKGLDSACVDAAGPHCDLWRGDRWSHDWLAAWQKKRRNLTLTTRSESKELYCKTWLLNEIQADMCQRLVQSWLATKGPCHRRWRWGVVLCLTSRRMEHAEWKYRRGKSLLCPGCLLEQVVRKRSICKRAPTMGESPRRAHRWKCQWKSGAWASLGNGPLAMFAVW